MVTMRKRERMRKKERERTRKMRRRRNRGDLKRKETVLKKRANASCFLQGNAVSQKHLRRLGAIHARFHFLAAASIRLSKPFAVVHWDELALSLLKHGLVYDPMRTKGNSCLYSFPKWHSALLGDSERALLNSFIQSVGAIFLAFR